MPCPPVRWTFEEPGHFEAMLVNGDVVRGRLQRTASHCLYAERNAMILLPVRLPAQPHLITAYWSPVRAGTLMVRLLWARDDLVLGPKKRRVIPRHAACGRNYVRRFLLFEDRILMLEEGVPIDELTYEKPFPGDRLVLSVSNSSVDELSIRALRPEEFAEFRRLRSSLKASITEELGPFPDKAITKNNLHLSL